MEKRRTKIMCTVGPASISPETLGRMEACGADYFRINLSHTRDDQLEPWIRTIGGAVRSPMVLDTEGPQLRTGPLVPVPMTVEAGAEVRVTDKLVPCTAEQIHVRPEGILRDLEPGDLISIDFENVLLKVMDSRRRGDGFVRCQTVVGGTYGANRAVSVVGKEVTLPPYSDKDQAAFRVAKRHGVSIFTLSFVGSGDDIRMFREACPDALAIAKVETRRAIDNLDAMVAEADGLLLDRGDLGREIPPERVPLVQAIVSRRCRDAGKPLFIATGVLESMTTSTRPTRAEVNDVFAGILQGVEGFVLAKETAIGKHPARTVSYLARMCEEAEGARRSGSNALERILAATALSAANGLVRPHGGKLVDRLMAIPAGSRELEALPWMAVDEFVLLDAEQIAIGTYSPLTGFMSRSQVESVLTGMRLPGGEVWTVPIILPATEEQATRLRRTRSAVLSTLSSNEPRALLRVGEIWPLDREDYCRRLFGTTSEGHPGVRRVMAGGEFAIGGEIELIARRSSPYRHYELTPAQTRQVFAHLGWSRVVGFHTRNPPHRSHEYLQLEALRRTHADGVLVQPVIGPRRPGDFTSEAVLESYRVMEDRIYPKERFLVAALATYPRYAGPREAVFTAICRKNFGCSHFIVGRDHAGVDGAYPADASHRIFEKFPDLGISAVTFREVVYCRACGRHLEIGTCPHDATHHARVSGTEARRLLTQAEDVPDWLARPEIRQILQSMNARGLRVIER